MRTFAPPDKNPPIYLKTHNKVKPETIVNTIIPQASENMPNVGDPIVMSTHAGGKAKVHPSPPAQ